MTATVTRSYCSHTPQWQRFQTQLMAPSHQVAAIASAKQQKVHPYQRQYAHVYHARYQQLAPLCWQAVEAAEASDNVQQRVNRILELTEGRVSVVVGTLVKEALPDNDGTPFLVEGCECRATDGLFLEDDSGRVALEFAGKDQEQEKHQWPTGAVVAVQGTVGTDGTMQVERFIPPVTMMTPDVNMHDSNQDDPCYLLVLSGLDCGNPAVPPTARDLLMHFLQGRLPHNNTARHVSRVLVAGGWASPTKQALQDADAWLDQVLATGIPCDIMPGQDDATTANWPQRPLHRSLVPRSSRYKTCHCTPNPYQAKYTTTTNDEDATTVVLATDGLNVRAQQAVTCTKTASDKNDTWQTLTALQVMQQHLDLRHLCPVGPSRVPTVPHAEQDPVVLDDNDAVPRLYVTGGHQRFATTMSRQGTRLLAVPSFGQTGTAVLVELRTLQVQLLKFVDETA